MPNIDFSKIPTVANVLNLIWLLLFLGATAVELVSAYFENEKVRRFAKCFCLGFLSLIPLTLAISGIQEMWIVFAGAVFGDIGDLFLLKKSNHKLLALGALAFFIGHCCYIAAILVYIHPLLGEYAWAAYLTWIVAIIIFVCAFYPTCRRIVKNGKLATALIFYLSLLGSVPLWALTGCILGKFAFLFVVLLGGITFVSSDVVLGYSLFGKDFKRRDFFIMALYLLGQTLIVAGFILTSLVVA